MFVYKYSLITLYTDSTVDNYIYSYYDTLNPTRLSRIGIMDPRVLVCAQRGRGHILQRNSAVLCVSAHIEVPRFLCSLSPVNCQLLSRVKKWILECCCLPTGVEATFCSKKAPFFCVCRLQTFCFWARVRT